MAKLTPDATRTEHGLVINEKIIPWGAVWPKDSGAYKKGAQYKADRLLSGGTGKVKGVTIHNTAVTAITAIAHDDSKDIVLGRDANNDATR